MKHINSLILFVAMSIFTVDLAWADESSVATASVTNAAPFPGAKSQWEGFDRYDFQVDGQHAIVVVPKQSLPGRPWAWRAEFFGIFANTDAALLTNGFYVVFLGLPDLFGSPQAVKAWDIFYDELTGKHGLAKKTALIGLSRGGLYCYNWAIANPDKVACIYADAPVCDFKSWPGGKLKGLGKGDGSIPEWNKMLKAYGFKSDAEAIAYPGNPVDNLKPLADKAVPLLHVYGDADPVVPCDENTGVVAKRYRKMGGSITLMPKAGVGHHPHGFTDPKPIVDFIMKNAGHPE
jgi:pimeloyl-ACP methyl ester carboxylesterase